jgi:prophage regulatory protein
MVHAMAKHDVLDAPESEAPDEELWSLSIVIAKTGLSRSTIYAYIAIGAFPVQRRLGPRRIAWLSTEVRAWIRSRPPQATA